VDGTLKVWDATPPDEGAQRHTRTLKHAGIVYDVAFGPGGRLASASADNTVRQWDPQTGQNLFTFQGQADKFLCVAFSPDGRVLAAGCVDRLVRRWDAMTGRELPPISGFKGPVRSLAFGPNGRLATCGGLQEVQVWDTTTDRQLRVLPHRDFVYDVAFHRDGNHIATAGSDMTVKVWNATDGNVIHTLEGHTGRVTSVAFSPDGRLLAAGDTSQTVKVWDWADEREIDSYSEHNNHVFGMDFSPSGRYLASASWAEVIVFDLHTNETIRPPGGHAGTIWGVAFSLDGQQLAVASGYKGKGEVKVWDTVLWNNKASGEQ
jgi:WD40 repeat protein